VPHHGASRTRWNLRRHDELCFGLIGRALAAPENRPTLPRCRSDEDQPMKTKVAELEALQENKGFCLKAEGVKLVLVKTGGAVYAVENRCPHVGVPIGRGKIEHGQIVCPFHGSRFNLATGENVDWVSGIAGVKIPDWSSALLSFGKKPQPIRTFPVTVEGQDVYVEL
jgi:nitrite reductase/ring-hydroxylating ferredoxin subunit